MGWNAPERHYFRLPQTLQRSPRLPSCDALLLKEGEGRRGERRREERGGERRGEEEEGERQRSGWNNFPFTPLVKLDENYLRAKRDTLYGV